MENEDRNLKEEIEALKSLHVVWTTLNKLKADSEVRTWPFFDNKYSLVIYDEEIQKQF